MFVLQLQVAAHWSNEEPSNKGVLGRHGFLQAASTGNPSGANAIFSEGSELAVCSPGRFGCSTGSWFSVWQEKKPIALKPKARQPETLAKPIEETPNPSSRFQPNTQPEPRNPEPVWSQSHWKYLLTNYAAPFVLLLTLRVSNASYSILATRVLKLRVYGPLGFMSRTKPWALSLDPSYVPYDKPTLQTPPKRGKSR